MNSNNKHGFTLIELLLGLLLFSIIGYTVYATFASGIRLNKRAEAVGTVHRQAFWALDEISLELENMVPYDFSGSYEDKIAFEGGPDEVRFLSAGKSGLRMIRYYLDVPNAGDVHKVVLGRRTDKNVRIIQGKLSEEQLYYLYREEIPFVEFLNDRGGEKEILCNIVKSDGLRFRYASGPKEDQPLDESVISWDEEWLDPALPVGVRVELSLLNQDDPDNPVEFSRDIFIPIGELGGAESQP